MAEKTHYKKLRNPNYLGSWDLPSGKDLVVTITNVKQEMAYNPTSNDKEEVLIAEIKGYKPLILNSTNCKNITKAVGSPYVEDWKGKYVSLYVAKVKAFGDTVDAIRVRPTAPKKATTILCTKCGNPLKPAHGLDEESLAQYTTKNYGAILCADCATQAKKEKDNK